MRAFTENPIFVEKGSPDDILHVFFIRGELSFTTRSLQYYFFNKLQFTNVRFEVLANASHVETSDDLAIFLGYLAVKDDHMKKIREKVRLNHRPFIYKFKSKDGNQEREEVDLMKLEIQIAKNIFIWNNNDKGSFVLLGNHFKWEGSQMRVPDVPASGKNYIEIFVQRATDSTTASIDSDSKITPMALTILNKDTGHKIPEVKNGVLSRFNFIKVDGVWKSTILKKNPSGTWSWNLGKVLDNSSESESIDLLEKHIFSSEGEAATTTPKLFTNFMQSLFYYKLHNMVNGIPAENDKFENILYKHNHGKVVVTFDDLEDDVELQEPMRGKYHVVGELKKSFDDDVLFTSVNPFKRTDYGPTTTLTTKSSSSSAGKKEGMSGGMIALIVSIVLVALIVIGVFGWYYFVKRKETAFKRKIEWDNK